MKFLDGNAVKDEIKKLIKSRGRLRVAVAYWGTGAVKELGLDKISKKKDVKIVCDLMSGACSVTELRYLILSLPPQTVEKVSKLHGKVWLSENAAIIGSSNASTNGLGFEGKERSGLIEANILIEDKNVLKLVGEWFDRLKKTKIDEGDLLVASEIAKRNRTVPPLNYQFRTLLSAIKNDISNVKDLPVQVWIWEEEGLDDWAELELQEREDKINAQNSEGLPIDLDCFQTKVPRYDLQPGTFIISFHFNRIKDKITFDQTGMFIIPENPVLTTHEGHLLFCIKVDSISGIGIGDRKMWLSAACSAANRKIFEDPDELVDFDCSLKEFTANYLEAKINKAA